MSRCHRYHVLVHRESTKKEAQKRKKARSLDIVSLVIAFQVRNTERKNTKQEVEVGSSGWVEGLDEKQREKKIGL